MGPFLLFLLGVFLLRCAVIEISDLKEKITELESKIEELEKNDARR